MEVQKGKLCWGVVLRNISPKTWMHSNWYDEIFENDPQSRIATIYSQSLTIILPEISWFVKAIILQKKLLEFWFHEKFIER